MTRREFGRGAAGLAAGVVLSRPRGREDPKAAVVLVKTGDRREALAQILKRFELPELKERDIILKADYGSPRPFPATTHPAMLSELVRALRDRGCGKVTLLERSAMGRTREVWRSLGFNEVARELRLELLALEDAGQSAWRKVSPEDSHWKNKFEIPVLLTPETLLIQISNLKVHRFGAYFSGSLKNSLGMVAKTAGNPPGYNYMEELHASEHMRLMIAEAAWAFHPALVVMDASSVFIEGGPESGRIASPGILMASRDRVALDAAGVALLQASGAKSPLTDTAVFEQEQISRAVELELGVTVPEAIGFATEGREGELQAMQLKGILESKPSGDKKER